MGNPYNRHVRILPGLRLAGGVLEHRALVRPSERYLATVPMTHATRNTLSTSVPVEDFADVPRFSEVVIGPTHATTEGRNFNQHCRMMSATAELNPKPHPPFQASSQ
jgi:hypothetical protein